MTTLKAFVLFILSIVSIFASAQNNTIVNGTITDASNGETLPFVSVVFPGKNMVGVTANEDGKYVISGKPESATMQVTLMGYEVANVKIVLGTKQTINVALKPQMQMLDAAVISGKRGKYSNKNNPAVDLVRKVIANKNNNRMEAHEYYQYNKYEKLEMGLNNFILDSTAENKSSKSLGVIYNHLYRSDVTGKMVLPIFFKEGASVVYYRKSPEAKKEYLDAMRMVDIMQFVNMESIEDFVTNIFGDANIYDSKIMLFTNEYMGPLSSFAPNYYRFHIMDTVLIDDMKCVQLAFFPRNAADFGFRGNVYITTDSTYAVKKAELQMPPNANVNFLRNFNLTQTFVMRDSTWCLAQDDINIEFVISKNDKRSILAKHSVQYSDYKFDQPIPKNVFSGAERVVKIPDYDNRPLEYWQPLRPTPLSAHEAGVFGMIDTLKHVPLIKYSLKAIALVFSGYTDFGMFDVGPVVSFLSFNSLEGMRVRFGGKTNAKFSPHLFFSAYGAYGFEDKQYKYDGTVMYSFSKKKNNPWEFPINMLQASYSYDVKIPGQAFLYGSGDKLILSFIRGTVDKINYERKAELFWHKETRSGFTIKPSFTWLKTYPEEALKYIDGYGHQSYNMTTAEVGLFLRFAPNERFFQVQADRFPLNQTDPIIEVGSKMGIKNFMGGQYTYNRTDATFYKRLWVGGFGYADMWFKAGKLWNAVPYPLLITPQANQSFAYQDEAYNMMNYMEFVADQYVSANLSYGFNGYIANRIPLVRKLKLREFITFKAFWGTLSDKNKPENDASLFLFPTDGVQTTVFALDGSKPYMEASIGIDNIFKVLRIDVIRRLNYLENPNVPTWGVRFRMRPSF